MGGYHSQFSAEGASSSHHHSCAEALISSGLYALEVRGFASGKAGPALILVRLLRQRRASKILSSSSIFVCQMQQHTTLAARNCKHWQATPYSHVLSNRRVTLYTPARLTPATPRARNAVLQLPPQRTKHCNTFGS